jgi:hypothetical protein
MEHADAVRIDPELEALPEPRRPWRRTTLATMAITAVASVYLAYQLLPLVTYATRGGAPAELGSLTGVQQYENDEGAWVHATGVLAARGAEYRRPLDSDRYRVVQVENNPRMWVELRIPKDIEPEHYVAPNSFVGRLTPIRRAGIRHASLPQAIDSALGKPPQDDAWLLIDGESPASTRWAAALSALLVAFAAFNLWGLFHLLRRAGAVHPST